jgi:type VI secretion system protein ImpH
MDLREELLRRPHRFDFFQAVRLIEQIVDRAQTADGTPRFQRVGHDANPTHELIRFKAVPSLSFPPDTINGIKILDAESELLSLVVTFIGLTGPQGALPQHYTELLMRRLRQKDFALAEFLDIFNHRLISLFYRSWEKYKLPLQFERARRAHQKHPESFTLALQSLTGASRHNLIDTVIFYGGLFAHSVRSATALQGLLHHYLGLPVSIKQFQGNWLTLARTDQSRLGGKHGQYQRLAVDAVAGGRVWNTQSSYTIQIGPVDRQAFRTLQPDQPLFQRLCALAEEYAGPTHSFKVEIVLKPGQAPGTTLCPPRNAQAARLGWSTWMIKQQPSTATPREQRVRYRQQQQQR